MWVEAGVPEESPRVQAFDHHILSHTTTVDHGNRTRVAAVRTKCHYSPYSFVNVCLLIHVNCYHRQAKSNKHGIT